MLRGKKLNLISKKDWLFEGDHCMQEMREDTPHAAYVV